MGTYVERVTLKHYENNIHLSSSSRIKLLNKAHTGGGVNGYFSRGESFTSISFYYNYKMDDEWLLVVRGAEQHTQTNLS